ncbi:hypothetical protein CR513_18889, partial [Mucuna pruriens]
MVTMFIDTPFSILRQGGRECRLQLRKPHSELGIRRGKFSQANNNIGFAKKPISEKKKGETNAVLVEPIFPHGKIHIGPRPTVAYTNQSTVLYIPPYQLQTDIRVAANTRTTQQGTRRPPKTLTPIPMPYIDYDPNARCDYHGGVVGHAIERCWSLKHKVQDLLDGGLLGF